MVSLSVDTHGVPNSGSRGAFFFDDLAVEQDDSPTNNVLHNQRSPRGPQGPQGSINGDDDDVMLIPSTGFRSPSSGSGGASDFPRLKTPLILLFEGLLFVAVAVSAFLLPHFLHSKASPETPTDHSIPYYILLYAQSMLWFVIFVIDRTLWLQHRKIQMRGYLDFHRKNKTARQAPLIVVSLFNSLLLLAATLLQQFPLQSPEASSSSSSSAFMTAFRAAIHSLDKNNVVEVVVTVEAVCALVPIAILLVRTLRFNGEALQPDVQQEDAMMQSAVPGFGTSSARDVGFRDASLVNVQEGDSVSSRELIEKQADQIRYLKSQCANLSRKCLKFQAQIDSIRDQ